MDKTPCLYLCSFCGSSVTTCGQIGVLGLDFDLFYSYDSDTDKESYSPVSPVWNLPD